MKNFDRYLLAVRAMLLVAFLLVTFTPNKNTISDPRGTLLVSESILKHHTIKLDHYGLKPLLEYGLSVQEKNEHLYYYFPLGTSVVSLPFVAVALGWGMDMQQSEGVVQIAIASFTAVLTLLYLIKLAGMFVGPRSALFISAAFWFGTSLTSTLATALWSHNFAVLFALMAIYYSIKATLYKQTHYWPAIAALLFLAYFCRPTLALLSPFLLLYLFSYHKAMAFKTALALAGFLIAFAGFSLMEFGQLLPDYYVPQRLTGAQEKLALYGNTLSPSRGLLIYSPFLIVTWLCFRAGQHNKLGLKPTWLLVGLAWPVAHLFFISRFPHWWGGFSYGARFMADCLPGLFLLTLYAWPTDVKSVIDKTTTAILAASVAFSIVVNTGQGLFSRWAPLWSSAPNIDEHPEYLLDWSYPQFLANQKGHAERLIKHSITLLKPVKSKSALAHDSSEVVFVGWAEPEATHRWSSSHTPKIMFIADVKDLHQFTGELVIVAGTLGKQRVTVSLNGHELFTRELESEGERMTIPYLVSLLKHGTNEITFSLPDARVPGVDDTRLLGLALMSFSIG